MADHGSRFPDRKSEPSSHVHPRLARPTLHENVNYRVWMARPRGQLASCAALGRATQPATWGGSSSVFRAPRDSSGTNRKHQQPETQKADNADKNHHGPPRILVRAEVEIRARRVKDSPGQHAAHDEQEKEAILAGGARHCRHRLQGTAPFSRPDCVFSQMPRRLATSPFSKGDCGNRLGRTCKNVQPDDAVIVRVRVRHGQAGGRPTSRRHVKYGFRHASGDFCSVPSARA